MKRLKLNYIFRGVFGVIFILLITSCDDLSLLRRVEPKLDIQEEIFTSPSASRQVLKLHSTYPWFAESSDSWIKLQRYRGQALKPDSIVVEIAENPNMESREGWIEVRLMDQMSKRIPVKQNGRGTLITLPKKLIYFNVNGGETILDVFTNLDWDIDVKQSDGFTFSKVDKNHLKIKTDKNTSGQNKEKVVTLKEINGKETAELKVIQTNVEKMLSIPLSKADKDIVVQKGSLTFDIPVSLNVAYECQVSDPSWIKISDKQMFSGDIVQDITIRTSVDANLDGEERSGYVVIKNAGEVVTVSDTLYISQKAKSQIIYVKSGAKGDGTSWERPFGTIEEGMAACTDKGDMELWVAEGNYQLKEKLIWKAVNVYGGFKGSETKLKERDLSRKSTLIGGKFQMMSAWGTNSPYWYYFDGFILTGTNDPQNGYQGTLEFYKHMALRNCFVHSNTYGKNAGGVFIDSRLINCVFYNNYNTLYSAVVNAANTDLYNVTIVNNKGDAATGGGLRLGGTTSIVYNSVIWGNTSPKTTSQLYLDNNKTYRFVNTFVQDGFSFNGGFTPVSMVECVALDKVNTAAKGPSFVNPDAYDYRLQKSSILIDAGNNKSVIDLLLSKDIVGKLRIFGVNVDVGAFEYFTK